MDQKSNEEIFSAVFADREVNPEAVLMWNEFITKRGWRDTSIDELQAEKEAAGLGLRTDIKTFVDFHDVDEMRVTKFDRGKCL